MSKKAYTRPPVVMIHGAFCGGWAFDGWRNVFEAQGYRTHAPTLRHHNHGLNPPTALGTTSMRDYADDLERDQDEKRGECVGDAGRTREATANRCR